MKSTSRRFTRIHAQIYFNGITVFTDYERSCKHFDKWLFYDSKAKQLFCTTKANACQSLPATRPPECKCVIDILSNRPLAHLVPFSLGTTCLRNVSQAINFGTDLFKWTIFIAVEVITCKWQGYYVYLTPFNR